MTDIGQWTTAVPLIKAYDAWIGDAEEQKRIAAYALYEAIYWGVPDTFKLLKRGSETSPIYLPAGRSIVDTINRYTANAVNFLPDPLVGTPEQQAAAVPLMKAFLTREKFTSKFSANKREGIMRGDWFWHIYADPARPEGARISIQAIDPGSCFPIYNELNVDEIIGWHIVEQYEFEGKPAIKRLTYRKTTGTGGPSPITMEDTIFEVDKWGGPGMSEDDASVLAAVTPMVTLPVDIDHLPVYHCQNFTTTGTIWGSSELRGYERIIAAMNQAISDEELALALDGLGVYVTDAGTPIDDDGNEVPWNLGPGRVVELPSSVGEKTKFERVNGVTTVGASLDHIRFLIGQLDEAAGTPSIAKGSGVDVKVAESGISLLLQLAPLLTKAEDKELVITDVHAQMFYDLRKWFASYEPGELANAFMNTAFVPLYGDKVPVNRKERFGEILALAAAGIVTQEWTWSELAKIGYEFPDSATFSAALASQKMEEAQLVSDVTGSRLDAALNQ